jgi:hypothetical protein
MGNKIERKSNLVNNIEYYFLRKSAEGFSADLRNFVKEAYEFSDEELLALVSFYDHIKDSMAIVKKELERRLEIE